MKTLTNLFTRHPESVGESYFEHFGVAMTFGLTMFFAALCCFVHAVLPFLFTKTGSECIEKLHARMSHRGAPPETDSAGFARTQ